MRRWRRRQWFRVQVAVAAAICAAAIAVAAPNLVSKASLTQWPSWFPNRQVRLGIEFTGGTMLLLETDWPAVEREWAREFRNTVRFELRDRRLRYEELRIVPGPEVRFRSIDAGMAPTAAQILRSASIEFPGVPVGEPAGVTVSVVGDEVRLALDEIGRTRLRNRAVDAAFVHEEIKLRRLADCRGRREGQVIRRGNQLQLTFRGDPEANDGCRHY